MKKISFFIIIIIFLLCDVAFSEELSSPLLSDYEHGIYRTIMKDTGEFLWKAEWILNKEIPESRGGIRENVKTVRIKETGYGKYKNAKNPISWNVESTFTLENPPKVLKTIRTAITKDGIEIWRKSKIFDYSGKRLLAQEYVSGELVKSKVLNIPEGSTFPTDILPILLRGYNFNSKQPAKFHIFSTDGKLYKINTKIVNVEEITVPAGSFRCYKLELILDMGLLNKIVGYFLPKTFMWFTVNTPHTWIKYEGLESGLNSPYVVMELTDFKDKKE
jgi:hypothetical protein